MKHTHADGTEHDHEYDSDHAHLIVRTFGGQRLAVWRVDPNTQPPDGTGPVVSGPLGGVRTGKAS